MLQFHTAGNSENKIVVLIHAWGCPWEMWLPYIRELQKEYYLIVPSLEGYNNDGAYGKGADYNALEILRYLKALNRPVHGIAGISYGANVLLRMLAAKEIVVEHAIADAGYIPNPPNEKEARKAARAIGIYRFAKPFRKLLINTQAKARGAENATMLVDKVLSLPIKTLREDMYSYCTTQLPEDLSDVAVRLELWYGEKETEKIVNAEYLKTRFPNVEVKVFPGYDHADFIMRDVAGYTNEICRAFE